MAIVDGHGLPLAVSIASVAPHETKLVADTLEQRFLPEPPQHPIGDRAYDSELLDELLLQQFGIELIAPHKTNRVAARTQDGRVLRRYGRLVTRWEYHADNFLAMIQLACALILLKRT